MPAGLNGTIGRTRRHLGCRASLFQNKHGALPLSPSPEPAATGLSYHVVEAARRPCEGVYAPMGFNPSEFSFIAPVALFRASIAVLW